MEIETILAAFIGPVLTALLATGGVGLKHERSVRRADRERARIIDQATQEAAFINSWLSARDRLNLEPARLADTSARAMADLERLYATIRSVDVAQDLRSGSGTFVRLLRASLLSTLRRPWAKVVRVVYFIYAGFVLIISMVVIAAFLDTDPASAIEVASGIAGAIWTIAILLTPAFGLWALARALDRPRAGRPGNDEIKVARTPAGRGQRPSAPPGPPIFPRTHPSDPERPHNPTRSTRR